MKLIRDLSREERLLFLRQVENKEIDIKSFKEKPPLFLTTKADVWSYLLVEDPPAGIILTSEAKEAFSMLSEVMDTSITNQ